MTKNCAKMTSSIVLCNHCWRRFGTQQSAFSYKSMYSVRILLVEIKSLSVCLCIHAEDIYNDDMADKYSVHVFGMGLAVIAMRIVQFYTYRVS